MIRSKKSLLSAKQLEVSRSQFPSLSVLIPSKSKQDLLIESPSESAYSSTIISGFQGLNQNHPKTLTAAIKSPKMKQELTPLLAQITEKNTGKSRFKRKTAKDQFSTITKSFLEAKMCFEEVGLNEKVFFMYEKIFLQIINQDQIFGLLLSEIKAIYDQWFNDENLKFRKDIKKLRKELDSKTEENRKMLENLETKKEEIKKLCRNLRILCDENLQLGNKVEELNTNCEEINQKLLKITQVSVENVSTDMETWKALITCNKEYEKMCKRLTKRVKSLENREQKMLDSVNLIKKSGNRVKHLKDTQDLSVSKFEEIKIDSKSEISRSIRELPKIDLHQVLPSSCSYQDLSLEEASLIRYD